MKISSIARKLPVYIELNNLGGRSSFSVHNYGNKLSIVNSSGAICEVNQDLIDKIWERYTSLPESRRFNASQYVHPSWPECPNMVFSPLIARIFSYLT